MRETLRSESEQVFDNKTMQMAKNLTHMNNLRRAYESPQNKGIAQSFRYMRNKPTIIAFKTPSLESFEASKNNLDIKMDSKNESIWMIDFSRFIFHQKLTKQKKSPTNQRPQKKEKFIWPSIFLSANLLKYIKLCKTSLAQINFSLDFH